MHLQPIYRLSCSIRRSSAPAPRPPSPPWLSARLRSSPSPPPALFTIILCSLALSSCSRGSLKGGMERQGGGQGGCFRAAAQQQSSHGSDGPPARFQQLRRRFSARQLHAFSTRGLPKKNVHMCALIYTHARMHESAQACSRTPQSRATRRYARRVLGPGTQNTILRPTDRRGISPLAEKHRADARGGLFLVKARRKLGCMVQQQHPETRENTNTHTIRQPAAVTRTFHTLRSPVPLAHSSGVCVISRPDLRLVFAHCQAMAAPPL